MFAGTAFAFAFGAVSSVLTSFGVSAGVIGTSVSAGAFVSAGVVELDEEVAAAALAGAV